MDHIASRGKPYLLIPTVDMHLATRTMAQVKSTAGMASGSIISYDAEQRGFTWNANRLLAIVEDKPNASHVCFLNEDVRITQQGWLARLVEALDENERFGLASPSGMCRTQPMCHGRSGMDRRVQVVFQLPFFCTLVKKEVLQRLGHLDPQFLHYGSDSDFCERAKRAGWLLIWVADVYCQNELSPLIDEWKDRDQKLFFDKWRG